jgi:hypothetical protein
MTQRNEETVEARARPGDKGALFRLKAVAAGGDVTDVYGAEWCHEAPGAALRLDLAAALAPPIREHGEGVREAGVVRGDGKSSIFHPATTKEQLAYLLGVKDGQRLPVPPDAIREAVEGIADDYMTSETHHPGYVLIPTAKFETITAALSAQPVKDAVPVCRQCGKPSPNGDPCDGCKLSNLQDFMIEETLAMTDEEIMAEIAPEELEEVRAIIDRAIRGEVVCSFNPDASPKSPASVGLDPETVERCSQIADCRAEACASFGTPDGRKRASEARLIATAIRALTPEGRPWAGS